MMKFRETASDRVLAKDRLYGFKAEDVIDIHFHKRGFGSGIWYRLRSGRVVDAQGRRSRRSRAESNDQLTAP